MNSVTTKSPRQFWDHLGPGLFYTMITGLCSIAFATGMFVQRQMFGEEIAVLRSEFQNHRLTDIHPGTVSRDELEVMFRDIARRLDRIEARMP